MEITLRKTDNRLNIKISGRIDSNSARELSEAINANIAGVEEIIFDLEETSYVSSAGLRVFLNTRKVMLKQGSMKLIHVQSDVRDIFDMTGFTGLLDL